MRPILFHIFGFPINSYGVSKALAVLAAGALLGREFRRLGWNPDRAWNIVIAAFVAGFAGAKVYYLAEHAGNLTPMDFGGSGFTWYGGLIAGAITVTIMANLYKLALGDLAGIMAAPLSLAYGIGRIGCFLAGDGTYGKPSNLPWAMAFPHGTMPTLVKVQPTALYESAFAFILAALLWKLRNRIPPLAVFGLYAVLSGMARFLVETVRINKVVLLGMTQPQLWSLLLIAIGFVLLFRNRGPSKVAAPGVQIPGASEPGSAEGTQPDNSR